MDRKSIQMYSVYEYPSISFEVTAPKLDNYNHTTVNTDS